MGRLAGGLLFVSKFRHKTGLHKHELRLDFLFAGCFLTELYILPVFVGFESCRMVTKNEKKSLYEIFSFRVVLMWLFFCITSRYRYKW
jgi:hypothetical protein